MVEKNQTFLLENVLNEYKVPHLFETWNWVGDEDILPIKVCFLN